jgi:NAD-dependent dihydropyrimidine dehydrogenase PreA subunit
MRACPTGALRPTVPPAVRIGLAVLDTTVCVRGHGETCGVCLERCPFPGVAIGEGGTWPEIVAAHCTGCGLCAESCPTHAIQVVARPGGGPP